MTKAIISYRSLGISFSPRRQLKDSDMRIVFSNKTLFQDLHFTNSCLETQSWKCEFLKSKKWVRTGLVYGAELNKTHALSVKMIGLGEKPKKLYLSALCVRLVEIAREMKAASIELKDDRSNPSFQEFLRHGFCLSPQVGVPQSGAPSKIALLTLDLVKDADKPLEQFDAIAKEVAKKEKTEEKTEEKMFSVPVKRAYLEQMRTGRKTIEGRLNKPPFSKFQKGDRIHFHYYRNDGIICEVVGTRSYPSFHALLKQEGISGVLPEVRTLREGVELYESIPAYTKHVGSTGALAIEVKYLGDSAHSSKRSREDVESDRAAKKQCKIKVQYPIDSPLDMTLGEEYIQQMLAGKKTREGRINGGIFKRLRMGDHVRFFNKFNEASDVICRIERIEPFPSFRAMLRSGGVETYLPEFEGEDVKNAVNLYHSIRGYREREKKSGVLGLTVKSLGTSTQVYGKSMDLNPYKWD